MWLSIAKLLSAGDGGGRAGVFPVAAAMASRKAKYFCRGAPR